MDDERDYFEVTYFRYCRDASGRLVPVGIFRRSGRVVPHFPRELADAYFLPPDSESPDYAELVEELCQCLNDLERRRFLLAVEGGRSISEIAVSEGVSRQAVIDSFHRMARKNSYVEIWLRNKPNTNQHG